MRLNEIRLSVKDKIKIARDFIKWVKQTLKISGIPQVKFSSDKSKVRNKRTFGTTLPDGDIWVYVGERNTADMLRTLCHELVHLKQFQIGTATEDMGEEQRLAIEDEANAIAGRLMREYGKSHVEIYEGKTGSLAPDVAASLPATYALPELKNQDPYLQYRFGVSIAGAKGAKQRKEDGVPEFSRESAWGENQIVVSSDPNIEEYIDDALNQMGLKGKRLISTPKSEETSDVGIKSPVVGFKGYPR